MAQCQENDRRAPSGQSDGVACACTTTGSLDRAPRSKSLERPELQAARAPPAARSVRCHVAAWLPRKNRQNPTASAAFIETK